MFEPDLLLLDEPLGDHLRLRCTLDGQAQATVKLPLAGGAPPVEGQPVWLQFPRAHLRVYA